MWQEFQKVVSATEPELGLGVIKDVDGNTIEVFFSLSSEVRRYALRSSPIKRFVLKPGQVGKFRDLGELEINDVKTENGLAFYVCGEKELSEKELEAVVVGHGAEEQFFSKSFTHHDAYELRKEAWHMQSMTESNPIAGMLGARVTPLSHQLYIANEVSRRPHPRVILSDEVGLGKTIEAGLIFGALRVLDRANRVLILTPQSLVHQWVAEMYRKFGQLFSVIDEERCDEEMASQGISAFEVNQFAITAIDFLENSPKRMMEALKEDWDLVIIDEAHHYRWFEEEPNLKWIIAKKLSDISKGLLLLTATPQQHGRETEFGLLHLVDPARFSDYDEFLVAADNMQHVAELAAKIQKDQITDEVKAKLQGYFSHDKQFVEKLNDSTTKKEELLAALIDRHGTGRALFRNRRARLKGFPKRTLVDHRLSPTSSYMKKLAAFDPETIDPSVFMDIATARYSEKVNMYKASENPRYKWIQKFSRELDGEKALVICAKPEHAIEIAALINKTTDTKAAVFHEEMSVIDRDKQAAYFAEENGADMLICSEIGGEGRNFQFASKLVLMDIPRHPDLLEQRIGRLDRIGQGKEIEIHVPWQSDTPEEVLFTWFADGLNAFESAWNGAAFLLDHFVEDIFECFESFLPSCAFHDKKHDLLDELIKESSRVADEFRREKAESVDVLIDLNSYDESRGEELLDEVYDSDDNPNLEFFMRSMFDHYGVDYEEFDDRGSLLIKPESLSFIDKFPGISSNEESVITFDRDVALAREEISFLTYDHPIVEGSLGLIIERGEGVASLAKWPNSPRPQGVLVELSFVLEAVGEKSLELGRYLPTQLKEFQMDQSGKAVEETRHKEEKLFLVELEKYEVPDDIEKLRAILTPMFEKADAQAKEWAKLKVEKAARAAEKELMVEYERIQALYDVNPFISDHELAYAKEKIHKVTSHIRQAEPRLDGIRLIFCQ